MLVLIEEKSQLKPLESFDVCAQKQMRSNTVKIQVTEFLRQTMKLWRSTRQL